AALLSGGAGRHFWRSEKDGDVAVADSTDRDLRRTIPHVCRCPAPGLREPRDAGDLRPDLPSSSRRKRARPGLGNDSRRAAPDSPVVATVDLDLMDGLHLDYASLKRVGERMAWLAAPYVAEGVAPRSEIRLEAVRFGKTLKPTIEVEFSGVTGGLRAPGRPTG